ncbi:MAG: acetyltransferase [Lachnospiraceae bacterium]|nr:acetyltransferase [Lachnospiraceae bacterium]
MGRKLLLIGGGGHCRSVIDSALALSIFEQVGIVDTKADDCLGVTIVGRDEDIPSLVMSGWTDAFVTVGSIGDTSARRRLYELAAKANLNMPAIIDPSAIVAANAKIESGAYVGKGAIINTNAWVGTGAIINTGAIVEHDCMIGDFSHVSPGATVCGQVTVGNDSHIGAGSVVRQGSVIGHHVLVGAGSIVVSDLPDEVTAYGNPCKVVK